MTPVRIAGPDDEIAVGDLLWGGGGLYDANQLGFPFSRDKVRERIRIATEGRGGIIGVIDGDHELAAGIGLYIETSWYSDAVHLSELFLFVREPYRSRGYAADLFSFAKDCRRRIADGSGTPFPLLTSVVSRHRLKAKMRYWQKHARPIGGIYIIEDDQ